MKTNNESLKSYYSNLSVSIWQGTTSYCNIPPFNPHQSYPEYALNMLCDHDNPAYEGVRVCLKTLGLDSANYGTASWNPLGDIVKPGDVVVIKPNFVLSRHNTGGNIYAVITHPSVIRALVDYVYMAIKGEGCIVVADAPQMECNFNELLQVTQLTSIQELYLSKYGFEIQILDLRDFWLDIDNNKGSTLALTKQRKDLNGDPFGSVIVNLGKQSAFYGLPNLKKIYGADYNRKETIEHHHDDIHKYVISKTVMNADVVISVPKLKVHKKVGVTLNVKGLVGINTNKNCLVHYTLGAPEEGGDQFPSRILSQRESLMIKGQRMLSDILLAKQNPVLDSVYVSLSRIYKYFIKPWYGSVDPSKSIMDGGDWWGNDSAWRMVVDLYHISLFADLNGKLHDTPQRKFFSIVDGIVGGENNGPLISDSKYAGVIIAGFNPLIVDIVCTGIMGFNYNKLKWIKHLNNDKYFSDIKNVNILSDKLFSNVLKSSNKYLGFKPHPGWDGYLENNK